MRWCGLVGLALVPVACAEPGPSSPSGGKAEMGATDVGGSGETRPSDETIVEPPAGDYLDDDAGASVPDVDVDALGIAVTAVLADARVLHGGPVVTAYFALLDEADAGCPIWSETDGTPFWFDSCTTAAGARFDGFGYHYEYADHLDGDVTWNGRALYSVGRMTGTNGDAFEGAGGAAFLTGRDIHGQDVWYSYTEAGFAYDGASAAGTWLAEALEPDLTWYAVRGVDGVGAAVVVSGSVPVGESGLAALVLSELLLIDADFGSSCPTEPHGSLSILDDEGHWIDVFFDGPAWEGTPTPEDACDGCGAAWFRGEYLGEVCVDVSELNAWEDSPFQR